MPKTSTELRAWIDDAIGRVEADANRSADTHLHTFALPTPGVDLYLKDESVHPTGSLKHRLARSLFLYALCNGWLGPESTIIEASSGSTAVSEAHFARLIGLPFVAVMPATTSTEKIALIEFEGGRCHLVEDPATVYDEARRVAATTLRPGNRHGFPHHADHHARRHRALRMVVPHTSHADVPRALNLCVPPCGHGGLLLRTCLAPPANVRTHRPLTPQCRPIRPVEQSQPVGREDREGKPGSFN